MRRGAPTIALTVGEFTDRWGWGCVFGKRTGGALALGTAVLMALAGCEKGGAQAYEEKLKKAGFDNVKVTRDVERVGGKRKLVAYDFAWRVNTDGDAAACVVALEHPANSGGSLRGVNWHIDEVNGRDVTWNDASPDATTVRRLLAEHDVDC